MTSESGVQTLEWSHSRYPAWLRMVPDPPPVLWIRGDPAVFEQTAVAIVGSRAASQYARDVARTLAAGLVRAGLVVTSGMARGVDGAAHQGALDAGGCTIGVLGTGIDVRYPPEHAALGERVARQGVLLTEFAPGAQPHAWHFPRRNRIISGLSRAVVIVEASEKSGSLITARMALEQGREVMAVPGSVLHGRNRGAHALIKDGATPVEDAADILEALGWPVPDGAAGTAAGSRPSNPLEAALEAAGELGADIDVLGRATGDPAETLLAALTALELAGRTERLAGGRYVWVATRRGSRADR